MKAAWQLVEDVCGILIYIPLAQLLDLYLSHWQPWKNLTGAAINNFFHQQGCCLYSYNPLLTHPPSPEYLQVWIYPSATFCLSGCLGFFFFELWAVCPMSRSDLRYHGAREGTRECEQFPCTEQREPWGSRNVRGETWQASKKQPGNRRSLTHTAQRWTWLSFSMRAHTHTL